ncbi:U2 small nuclear ribonucleoprotein A' [Blomia tropicalis]|nr:U2 small nuclear ribonucleoprotein A' [Blomia tropicalis]
MKLTPDLIEGAFQFMNRSTRDRELDLRDYKIPSIENLGATLDQFDCIDLTNNDIRRIENFPLLHRLKRLYLSNNRVVKIDENLVDMTPNLEGILLINNQISELGDLDPLSKLTKLEMLALLGNPVTTKKHYRHYLIHLLPSLRLLDFKKIKMKEREEAEQLFGGESGKQLATEVGVKSKTFVPGGDLPNQNQQQSNRKQLSSSEVDAIKMAITKAKTLEEIERLNESLKNGAIPNQQPILG